MPSGHGALGVKSHMTATSSDHNFHIGWWIILQFAIGGNGDPWVIFRVDHEERHETASDKLHSRNIFIKILCISETVSGRREVIIEFIHGPGFHNCIPFSRTERRLRRQAFDLHATQERVVINAIAPCHQPLCRLKRANRCRHGRRTDEGMFTSQLREQIEQYISTQRVTNGENAIPDKILVQAIDCILKITRAPATIVPATRRARRTRTPQIQSQDPSALQKVEPCALAYVHTVFTARETVNQENQRTRRCHRWDLDRSGELITTPVGGWKIQVP